MKNESIRRFTINAANKVIPIFIGCGYTKVNTPLHAHYYYELELVMDGEATHIINGKSYEIKRGNAYILSPMDFHTYCLHSPLKAYCLNFDTSVISPKLISTIFSLDKSKPISIPEERLEDIAAIGDILIKECRKDDGGCSVELCNCFLSLIFAESDTDHGHIEGMQDEGLQRAIAYLNSHFFESPSLEEIAVVAGYNASYFSDLFKKTFAESYVSRLNGLKVEYAKVLLSHGSKVIDACFDSGFKSLSSFLSVFKKRIGMSPNDYKALHNH